MRNIPDRFDPDPVIEFYKKDIDREALRRNLRRSVAERLEQLQLLNEYAQAIAVSRAGLATRNGFSPKSPSEIWG